MYELPNVVIGAPRPHATAGWPVALAGRCSQLGHRVSGTWMAKSVTASMPVVPARQRRHRPGDILGQQRDQGVGVAAFQRCGGIC
jgi:hypothetical protein